MMNKKRTKEIGRTKYLMFIPLAALLMIISNIEAVARTTKEIATEVMQAVDTQPAKTLKPGTSTEVVQDSIIDPSETIFEVVERMPEFPGGIQAILKFIADYTQYPVEAQKAKIEGRVITQFVIDKEGFVKNITVNRGVAPSLDKEAIRIVKNMPKWKPGTQRGKAVNVRYTLPIMFKLQSPKAPVQKPVMSANGVYEAVEHMPEFPGGISGIMQYLEKNLVYPPEAKKAGKQGRVTVQMVIDREGNVTEVKTLRGVDPSLDKEAIRVVSSMPKWKPGMQKGEAVRVKYTLPIMFRVK